jgi:uncharacterized protein (TIGR02266 family)
MSEERRNTHRAHVPGVHATYETADGELQRAEVMDLAAGGLFLRTEAPTAVGKRVALDIVVSGEPAPWSALGRVVWIRPVTLDEERPAGMAIKLIDVDDEVQAGIERLVAMRERTEPGVGSGGASPSQAPAKERTMLGVGNRPASDLAPTPVAFAPVEVPVAFTAEPPGVAPAVAPARSSALGPRSMPPAAEPLPSVMVDVPPGAPIARETSIAIDLVAKKSIPVEAALATSPDGTQDDTLRVREEARPRRGGKGWILFLAVLAAAIAAYAFREQLLSVWNGVSS